MQKSDPVSHLLRSPGDLKKLIRVNEKEYQTENGEIYPIVDGIVCLLKANERGSDLGDDKFYEENPFGLRDWSNPDEVEKGIEIEFKDLLKQIPKDALIADVGSGTGRISNYLSMRGFVNVVSIDYSINSLKAVKANSNNYCIWGNNLNLPFCSDAFDFVISTGVIHHTPDPKKALSECARVVKPGGLLYLRLRNINSFYGYLYITYGTMLRLFESKEKLRILSDLLGFSVYKLTRKLFYSQLPKRDDKILRGKYENLFIKKMITFFNTNEVKEMLKKRRLAIQYGKKVSFTHRQHFYICRKYQR